MVLLSILNNKNYSSEFKEYEPLQDLQHNYILITVPDDEYFCCGVYSPFLFDI